MVNVGSRRTLLVAICAIPLMETPGITKWFARPRDAAPRRIDPATRLFGAAVRPDQLIHPSPLRDTILADCGLLVPEYHGQWSAVEWRRGEPWFGNYDAISDFAVQHGRQVRGHSLIWHRMTPDWAVAEMQERRDWQTVERHFATLLPRYRGRIGQWIVVNEMIDTEQGDGGMRRTPFQRAYGNDYVRRALETARLLDPDARLMINDYGLSHDNVVDEARRTQMLRLVETLKRQGAPLDMVGIQGHIELAKGAVAQKQIARFLADLAGMGVELAVTELDVLEADRTQPLDRRDAQVAEAVHAFLDVALDQPAVTSVVTWGLSDKDSWLQERSSETLAACDCLPIDGARLNRGLPFDGSMTAKPMREALRRVTMA